MKPGDKGKEDDYKGFGNTVTWTHLPSIPVHLILSAKGWRELMFLEGRLNHKAGGTFLL